ncbi:MAG: hypothetical protein AAGA91_13565 [Pseudomonadota bacterium]
MKILICADLSSVQDYIRLLAEAYTAAGHSVTLGPQRFLGDGEIPDVLHLHWPEQLYKVNDYLSVSQASLERVSARLKEYKRQGVTIVYTQHNLAPHEVLDDSFEKEIYRIFAQAADLVVHHGEASVRAVQSLAEYSSVKEHLVLPFGAYPVYAPPETPGKVLYQLPQSACVLLNFGLQRRYKGAAFIGSVFSGLDYAEYHLFTIGPLAPRPKRLPGRIWRRVRVVSNQLTQPIRKAVSGHTRLWRSVPNEEVSAIMDATDIVFLGHGSGLNSGLVTLAAGYAKPVVYPDIGNFGEQLNGWSWAEPYAPGDQISARLAITSLRSRLSCADEESMRVGHEAWIKKHDWGVHATQIIVWCKRHRMERGALIEH